MEKYIFYSWETEKFQFIGASNDEGNPLFVTELMEKSLRALLEQRQLAEIEIRVISLDVARAINYLHQKKPEPIIHRDVSSANVLLWRQGDQWRGKVSDYGTANFMQQTMTVAPGTSNHTVTVSFSKGRIFFFQRFFINIFRLQRDALVQSSWARSYFKARLFFYDTRETLLHFTILYLGIQLKAAK